MISADGLLMPAKKDQPPAGFSVFHADRASDARFEPVPVA